jgi:probable HAF family extracellular repeat protein
MSRFSVRQGIALLLAITWTAAQEAKAAPTPASPPRFDFVDLGALGFGGPSSIAYDINNKGQVVGWAHAAETQVREYNWESRQWEDKGLMTPRNAFLYDSRHKRMINLGRRNEGSEAYGINQSTRIVGRVGVAGNMSRAFRSHNGPLDENGEELGFLNPQLQISGAVDINDRGQVLGVTYDPNGFAAFIYEQNRMRSLGPLLGGPSHAHAINGGGIVAGDSFLNPSRTGAIHGYRLDTRTGQILDLGVLGPGNSHAEDINDHGVVVGVQSSFSNRAFIHDGTSMRDLGKFADAFSAEAYGINNNGDVVGMSGVRAVLWKDGQIYDLNTLLAEALPAGWTLTYAHAINDRGQIVGQLATPLTSERAFLLNPVGMESFSAAGVDPELAEILALTGTFSPSYFPEPVPEVVPEPASAALSVVAPAMALLRRRKRH